MNSTKRNLRPPVDEEEIEGFNLPTRSTLLSQHVRLGSSCSKQQSAHCLGLLPSRLAGLLASASGSICTLRVAQSANTAAAASVVAVVVFGRHLGFLYATAAQP